MARESASGGWSVSGCRWQAGSGSAAAGRSGRALALVGGAGVEGAVEAYQQPGFTGGQREGALEGEVLPGMRPAGRGCLPAPAGRPGSARPANSSRVVSSGEADRGVLQQKAKPGRLAGRGSELVAQAEVVEALAVAAAAKAGDGVVSQAILAITEHVGAVREDRGVSLYCSSRVVSRRLMPSPRRCRGGDSLRGLPTSG